MLSVAIMGGVGVALVTGKICYSAIVKKKRINKAKSVEILDPYKGIVRVYPMTNITTDFYKEKKDAEAEIKYMAAQIGATVVYNTIYLRKSHNDNTKFAIKGIVGRRKGE